MMNAIVNATMSKYKVFCRHAINIARFTTFNNFQSIYNVKKGNSNRIFMLLINV